MPDGRSMSTGVAGRGRVRGRCPLLEMESGRTLQLHIFFVLPATAVHYLPMGPSNARNLVQSYGEIPT